MKHILLLLCLVSCGNLEKKTFQHFYMSRKTRSNSEPKNAGYVYSQVINQPASFSTFYNGITTHNKRYDNSESTNSHKQKVKDCKDCSKSNNNNTETPLASQVKSSEKLTEAIRSDNPMSAASHMITRYDMSPEFHTDDEDVRTDPGNFYYGWPYFYHTPYEYEPIKYDIEVEKAKNKRFVEPRMDRIIPVYENHDEIPNNYIYSGPDYRHTQSDTTDNPTFGNKPFFSYTLNDYYDKPYDDDPFVFNDILWENEFDNEIPPHSDLDDYARRIRHLDYKYPYHHENNYLETTTKASKSLDDYREIIKSNKYDKKQDIERTKKGDNKIHRYKSEQDQDRQKYKEFKDFTDAFANKFGSEDHNKISKYSVKNNADKGKKKKGFRKVYHKDEYQEHDEFFDDNNNSINAEEHGDSKVRTGGSEAFLGSKAVAALGHEGNTGHTAENIDTNLFEKKYEDFKRLKGVDNDLKSYKDLARSTSALNNGNYFDEYAK